MPPFRRLATCLLCASLCLTLVKCSGSENDDRVTITFWHSFVSNTIPALNELISQFEEDHPGIRIRAQYVPTGDALVQRLVAAVRSNSAPDIAWIHSDFLDKLVTADAIYRMEEFIHGPNGLDEGTLADIFPALLKGASWRDTLYAMPMEATSLALFYNRELFRQAGLDPDRPPETWEELYDYAVRLTVDRNGNGQFDQRGFLVPIFPASGELNIWMNLQWTPFLWQAGGHEINGDQSQVLFNSEAGIQALTLWKRLYDRLDIRNFSQAHDLGFGSGRLAMILDGPWNLPRYRQLRNLDWAVAPLPAGPAGKATYIAGEHLAIFRQSRHPDKAWTFVKWVIQPEVQAAFSMDSGYLPVRQSVLQREEYQRFLETDPAMHVFVSQMEYGRGREPIDFGHVEVNRFLAEAIERATVGNQDPATVLNEAAARANAFLQN